MTRTKSRNAVGVSGTWKRCAYSCHDAREAGAERTEKRSVNIRCGDADAPLHPTAARSHSLCSNQGALIAPCSNQLSGRKTHVYPLLQPSSGVKFPRVCHSW